MIKMKVCGVLLCRIAEANIRVGSIPGVKELKNFVIYKNSMFYSSFPSVIRKPDGELNGCI